MFFFHRGGVRRLWESGERWWGVGMGKDCGVERENLWRNPWNVCRMGKAVSTGCGKEIPQFPRLVSTRKMRQGRLCFCRPRLFLHTTFPHCVETNVENRIFSVETLLVSICFSLRGSCFFVCGLMRYQICAVGANIVRPGMLWHFRQHCPRDNTPKPSGGIARFPRCPPLARKRR